jgi:hypothetical protein
VQQNGGDAAIEINFIASVVPVDTTPQLQQASSANHGGRAFSFSHQQDSYYATPVTVLRPSNHAAAAREAVVRPLREAINALASAFPAKGGSRNSNRGGWQLPHRTLLQMTGRYPGVRVAEDLIRAAIEAHVLAMLNASSSAATSAASTQATSAADHLFGGGSGGGEIRVKIDSSWANINGPGHWNAPHVHLADDLTADLSGALYVKCGDLNGRCTLGLIDARVGFASGFGGSSGSGSNSSTKLLDQLEAGDCVIFPSWLEHYVPPSRQPQAVGPRISVSFNAAVRFLSDGSATTWQVRFE